MNSRITHNMLEPSDIRDLNADIYTSLGTKDPELEDYQENDALDHEVADYYSIKGNYYYYLEVEEG